MTTDRQGAHRQAFPVVPGTSGADRREGARKQRSGDGTAEQLSSAPLRCICGFGHEAKATGLLGSGQRGRHVRAMGPKVAAPVFDR